MNCIMFRPSVRWMQASSGFAADDPNTPDALAARKGAVPSSRENAGPSPTSPLLASGSMTAIGSFHTKEGRLTHVEEQRSILVHVTIALDVTAQFCPSPSKPASKAATGLPRGGKSDDPPVVLTLSLPPNSTTHTAIGVIVEQFLTLRRCAGQSTTLHRTSPYHRVVETFAVTSAAKFRDVSSSVLALALLQSDLTLAVCDAAGTIVKPLRRFIVPKSAPNAAVPSSTSSSLTEEKVPKLSASSTVTQVAQALTTLQCSSAGFAVAQKSLLNHLASFVEPTATVSGSSAVVALGSEISKPTALASRSVVAGSSKPTLVATTEESKFQPPFSLLLYVDEWRARIRALQAKEYASRESLFLDATGFLHSFAIPYWGQFLQSDCALRADWILYQAHCRHRIHLLEREDRFESQQRTALREECESRQCLVAEEVRERQVLLVPRFERLSTLSFAVLTAWQTVVLRADANFHALLAAFERERRQVERLLSFKHQAVYFCEVGGPEEAEQTRREMLQLFHDSAVLLHSRK